MKKLAGVWLIVAYAVLSTLVEAGVLFTFLTGYPPNAPQVVVSDLALSLGYHLGIALGAICLFFRPGLALLLFIAASVFDLVTLVLQLQAPGALDRMTTLGWGVLAVEWAINLAIVFYTAGLARTPPEPAA